MGKVTLTDVTNLQSEQSAVATFASNNEKIEEAFDNTLSRDGSTPNEMHGPIDMNGNRIINVAAPVFPGDVVRYQDLQDGVIGVDILSIPSPNSHVGEFLTTDGTNLYWVPAVNATDNTRLSKASNLSDVSSPTTARSNLGLGSAATANTGTLGHYVPFLDAANTWTAAQSLPASSTIENTGGPQHESAVGFRGTLPVIKNQNYTFTNEDLGRSIYHTDAVGYTWTLPTSAALPGGNGHCIVLLNTGSAAVTIQQPTDGELRLVGTGASGNRTLAPHGLATLFRFIGSLWYISGTGVS